MAYTAKPFSIICPENSGPFLFTAEHASNHLPCSYNDSDQQFLQTHWAFDIGIAPLMKHLCAALSCRGVQTEFSRLWIDANRSPTQEGLIKTEIQGTPLSFNQNLSPTAREDRKNNFHAQYHNTISDIITSHATPPMLISMHSFTPIWNDQLREMDIGVLFDRDEDIAHALASILQDEGFFVALNQPYSGKNGLIYAADRHGTENNIPYVEFEFNQSIICSTERISAVANRMIQAFQKFLHNYDHLISQ